MTIRIPDTLLARLRLLAERERRSVHAQILVMLERGVEAQS